MVSNAFPLTRKSAILSKKAIGLVWHNLPLVDRRQTVRGRWVGKKGNPYRVLLSLAGSGCVMLAPQTPPFSYKYPNLLRGLRKERFEQEEYNSFVGKWRTQSQMRGLEQGKAANLMITFTSMAVDTLNDDKWQR